MQKKELKRRTQKTKSSTIKGRVKERRRMKTNVKIALL